MAEDTTPYETAHGTDYRRSKGDLPNCGLHVTTCALNDAGKIEKQNLESD